MKIKKVQINGFGNIENKVLDFSDGINLIYGENEAGKSTLVNFIKSVFYGVNKNKAGNEYSDYEKYKPWKDIDFSGKIEYELQGKTYTVFRDFNRNNCKIYDENGNDITNEFNKDKSRGSEVGLTHFGVDEETFMNTLFVNQNSTSVELTSQKSIMQKLTNMLQSGQENISFEKIKAKLQKKILDEIGTERSHNKPINVVNREISEKEQNISRLLNNRERKNYLEENLNEIDNQIRKVEIDIEQINEVLAIRNKYVSLVEDKERNYELTLKIKEKEKQDKFERASKLYKNSIICLMVVLIISCGALIFFKHYVWCLAELLIAIIAGVVLKKTNIIKVDVGDLPDLAVIKEELNKKEKKELEKLVKNGVKSTFTEKKLQELKSLASGYEKKKNDLILDGHKLKIEEESLKENIERLSDLEEQLVELKEKKEQLQIKNKVINIAIEKLDEAYEEIKLEVIPEMERNIKSMIQKTTNGEYVKTIYNNDEGILIENSLGEIVPVSKLSLGTIDQIYLGFRLGVANKIKELPIILDESFAFYDDSRLTNILDVLSNADRQIFILTCSNREKSILNKLNLDCNFIEI